MATDTEEARRHRRTIASAGPRNNEARYREREERKQGRRARGERPRIEEATSIDEALEAERETGRAEGRRERAAARTTSSSSSPSPSPRATRQTGSRSRGVSLPPSEGLPGSVTAPMVVEVILVTADELVTNKRFPLPSRLLVVFGFFGLLGLARGQAAKPAAALGWGIVAASFYASVAPGGQPAALSGLAAIGDFVSGNFGNNAGPTNGAVPAPPGVKGVPPGTPLPPAPPQGPMG